jgi:hypothetical protein
MSLIYIPHPLYKVFAPRKDGVYIVKKQGRAVYVGVAHAQKTGKNLKQAVKALFKAGNKVDEHFFEMRDIMAVKFFKEDNYEKALKMQKEFIVKYKTDKRYNAPKKDEQK